MFIKDSPAPAEPKAGDRRPSWIRGRLALVSKTAFGGRRAAMRPSAADPEAARLRTGLMTIRNLASFVQQHPDMPRLHREKIIRSLIRESEELKLAADRIARGAPLGRV